MLLSEMPVNAGFIISPLRDIAVLPQDEGMALKNRVFKPCDFRLIVAINKRKAVIEETDLS
jgi:hypothetical protein